MEWNGMMDLPEVFGDCNILRQEKIGQVSADPERYVQNVISTVQFSTKYPTTVPVSSLNLVVRRDFIQRSPFFRILFHQHSSYI